MALIYKNELLITRLKASLANSSVDRLSDLKRRKYGGRGGPSDEIAWSPNEGAQTANRLSDSWIEIAANIEVAPVTKRWQEDKTNYLLINQFQ